MMELANIYLGVVIILLLSIDGCHHYHSADGYHTSSINNRQSLLSLEAESNSSLISRGHGETIKTVPAKKGAIGLQFGQRSVIEAPICSFYGPRCTQARLNPEWFATTPPSTEGKHVDVLYLRDSYRQKDLSKSYRDAALVKETIYPLTPFLTAREVFDPAGKDSARVTYDFYALGTSDTARKRTLCLFYKWNMMLRIIGDKDLTHNFPHYTLYALRTFQGFPHVGVATRSIYFPKRKNGHSSYWDGSMIAHTFGTALFRHIWDPDLSEETKFSKDKEGPMLAGLQAAFADAVSCASQQVEGAITSSTDECIIGRYYVGGNKDGQNLGIRARPYVPSLSGYMRNPYAARQEQSKPSALHRIDSTFNIPRLTKERVNGLFGSVFYSFLANNIPVNEIARGVMLYHASYKALLKSSPSRTERNTPHDFQHIRDCLMRHFANSDADFFYAAAYVFQQHGMGKRLSTRSRVSSGGEVKYEEREKVYSLCY